MATFQVAHRVVGAVALFEVGGAETLPMRAGHVALTRPRHLARAARERLARGAPLASASGA